MKHHFNVELTVILLTILLGFIPNMVLSILSNTFWLNSSVDFPFLAIPTIFIGDLFFLPIFNLFAYKAIRASWQYINSYVNLYKLAISLITGSIVISSNIHFLWINDAYSGFMDIERGKLSAAGWWHLIFTILQITIVAVTVYLWIISLIKKAPVHVHRAYQKSWLVFFFFTLMNFPDLLFRSSIIKATSLNMLTSLITQLPSFSTTFFSILVFLSTNIIFRKHSRGGYE